MKTSFSDASTSATAFENFTKSRIWPFLGVDFYFSDTCSNITIKFNIIARKVRILIKKLIFYLFLVFVGPSKKLHTSCTRQIYKRTHTPADEKFLFSSRFSELAFSAFCLRNLSKTYFLVKKIVLCTYVFSHVCVYVHAYVIIILYTYCNSQWYRWNTTTRLRVIHRCIIFF